MESPSNDDKVFDLSDAPPGFGIQCTQCHCSIENYEKAYKYNDFPYHVRCFATLVGRKVCEQCLDYINTPDMPAPDSSRKGADYVELDDRLWHDSCFSCAHCFNPFKFDEEQCSFKFYEKEGRRYCQADYERLFAPFCGGCARVIFEGRVVHANGASWHPECFTCERCHRPLAEEGFVKNDGRALCRSCNDGEKNKPKKYRCYRCHEPIEVGDHIRVRGEFYHPYHFECFQCHLELTTEFRESKSGELSCLRCFDRNAEKICSACKRPIEDARAVFALDRHWHVEHFVCATCEKPFLGSKYHEKNESAYCDFHFRQLYGNSCFVCNRVISGKPVNMGPKSWCEQHFRCSICDLPLAIGTKVNVFDAKPVCKSCYEKLPPDVVRSLRRLEQLETASSKKAKAHHISTPAPGPSTATGTPSRS